VIILNLFGTTTGLELLQIPLAEIPASLKFENSWIEITERQIVTTADNDSFVVFRKIIGSNVVTWLGLYRPAHELGGSRSGGFYGTGVWLIDCVADVRALTETLRDLADQIQATAMNGDRFVRRIADARNEIRVSSLASGLTNNLVKIAGGCHPTGEVAFIASNGNALEVIDWAQRSRSAYAFSKIFIGVADQVPAYSGQTSVVLHRSLSLAIESTYVRLGNDLQSTRSELNDTRNELSSTQQTLVQAKKEVSDLSSDVAKLEFMVNQRNAKIKQLEEYFKRAQKQVSGLIRRPIDEFQTSKETISTTSNVPVISLDDESIINFPPNKVECQPQNQTTYKKISPSQTSNDSIPEGYGREDDDYDDRKSISINSLVFFILVILSISFLSIKFFKNHSDGCPLISLECKKVSVEPALSPSEDLLSDFSNTRTKNDVADSREVEISKSKSQNEKVTAGVNAESKEAKPENNKNQTKDDKRQNEKPRSGER
jgi:hypothetical protein